MRSDIVPGGIFPNYELPDHTGTPRKLSELQDEDPCFPHHIRQSRVSGTVQGLPVGRKIISHRSRRDGCAFTRVA